MQVKSQFIKYESTKKPPMEAYKQSNEKESQGCLALLFGAMLNNVFNCCEDLCLVFQNKTSEKRVLN